MKHIINTIIVIITVIVLTACNSSPVEREYIYIPVNDTVSESYHIKRIIELEHNLRLTKDSLNLMRDSLGEDLFIANYKLARIKRYNDIAAKGNNIKFLRGWINRVLND